MYNGRTFNTGPGHRGQRGRRAWGVTGYPVYVYMRRDMRHTNVRLTVQCPSILTMYKNRIDFMNEEKLVIGVEWPLDVIVL